MSPALAAARQTLSFLVVGASSTGLYFLLLWLLRALGAGRSRSLLSALGINPGIGNPLISQIVTATIGAIVVVFLARLIA